MLLLISVSPPVEQARLMLALTSFNRSPLWAPVFQNFESSQLALTGIPHAQPSEGQGAAVQLF